MPPIAALIADRFAFHAVDVTRFESHVQEKVLRLLRQLEQDLIRRLQRLDPTVATAQQRRLQALLRAVQADIRTAYQGISRTVRRDLMELAEGTVEMTQDLVNAAVKVPLLTVGVPSETLRALVDDQVILGAPAREWWSRQAGSTLERFSDAIRQGVFRGDTLNELIAAIRGTKEAGYRDGILEVSRRDAVSLIRTSVQSVNNAARYATLEANQDVLRGVQALVTLDTRTSELCMSRSGFAWDFEGKPLNERTKIPFPGPPPWHWRCRTTLIPIVKGWNELVKDRKVAAKIKKAVAKLPKSTQASMDGQVAEDLTYEQWLRTKPEAVQKEVLGEEKWKLWKAGQIAFTDLVDQRGRPLTLEELKARARIERPEPEPPREGRAASAPRRDPGRAARKPVKPDQTAIGTAAQLRLVKLGIRRDTQRGGGVNQTRLVEFEDGSFGIWKPVSGERTGLRLGIRGGTYYLREAAASDVAQLVRYNDLVPITAVREHAGELGSIQEFRQGLEAYRAEPVARFGSRDLDRQRAVLFDVVMGNTDRHAGNWLIGPGGKLVLIDHGLTLPTVDERLRLDIARGLRDLAAEIPEKLKMPWRKAWPKIEQALLKRGIERRAIDLAKARLDQILAPNVTWAELLRALKVRS